MSQIRFEMSAAVAAVLAAVGTASAQPVVFKANPNSGFFTPFNTGNASTVKYADSGWFGSGGDLPVGLFDITLGLAAFGSSGGGTTDVVFTFNDGDPARLDFGTGNTLYSTVIRNVSIPSSAEGAEFFSLTIPLPGVFTTGGFNNVGWSVALQNYNYDGQFGFQTGNAFGQAVGFYTNNAAFNNGTAWSQFAFGPGLNGVANFAATIRAVPTPGAIVLPGLFALSAARRRRGR